MNSELMLTDEVVFEDFQEIIKSTDCLMSPQSTNSGCKTVLSNIVLINTKPVSNISQLLDSKVIKESSDCIESKISSCLDNFKTCSYIDAISIGSETIEETCSGSSLQRFDSLNNSDSFDDETFLEDTQRLIHTDTFIATETEISEESFIQELKTAIKIKWIDRAIYIKKLIQQKSQDLWDIYYKRLTSEEQLVLSDNQALEFVGFNQDKNSQSLDDETLIETLNTASEVEINLMGEEAEYSIDRYGVEIVIPNVIENTQESSMILSHCNLNNSIVKKNKNTICNNNDLKFEKRIKEQKRRTKSLSWPNVSQNGVIIKNHSLCTTNEQLSRTIESLRNENTHLVYEINNRQAILDKMQYKINEISFHLNQRISDLRSAHGTVQRLKVDLFESRKNINKVENENNNLHKINENLLLFKTNAEGFILKEQKNNEILSKRIENLNAIEYDYQWLYKAFMDYKSLGQDYDNLQFNYFESQMKFTELQKTIDALQNQIKYLEHERDNNRYDNDEMKNANRGRNLENLCQCHPITDYRCCPHSRSRSSRSKRKKEKKSKKLPFQSNESESDLKPAYDEPGVKIPQENIYSKMENYENPKPDIKELERRYDSLQIKKRTLESELSHVPISGTSSIRQSHAASRGEKEYIESELDVVDQEISSIRRTLKQFNVMGDRNAHYNKTS